MTVWNDAGHAHQLAHATWMANTAVLMHLNERATGDPARDWLSSWAHRWFAGDHLRVLVLGCGEGWLERAVAQWPFVAHIDAVDFAEEAVARARAEAAGISKIRYGVVDLNRDELPREAYDVVLAHSVLHHVENLEHAYAQIAHTMRPDATLIVNEYAGPNRFQYSDAVLSMINSLLGCLGRPARTRPTVAEMIANDPTEAVRSDELIAFTERHFEVLERRNIGGTILQHLLYEIAEEYRFEVPRERAIVEMLCTIEAMLVDEGRIPCDYVILAARKRGATVTRSPRPLPPRPEAAKSIDEDPLAGRFSRSASGATRSRIPWPVAMRMLRIGLLAEKPARANLYRESALLSLRERFRARGTDPLSWVENRVADETLRCLIRTAGRF
jgi:2-polyprenyl-3-methyl-5-hydroxy-6-metoxy-1,4-benzoquinol methylase